MLDFDPSFVPPKASPVRRRRIHLPDHHPPHPSFPIRFSACCITTMYACTFALDSNGILYVVFLKCRLVSRDRWITRPKCRASPVCVVFRSFRFVANPSQGFVKIGIILQKKRSPTSQFPRSRMWMRNARADSVSGDLPHDVTRLIFEKTQ